MTKTEIALHLIRCGTMTINNPNAQAMVAMGNAEVKRGRLCLTPAGHALLRGK